MMRRWLLLVGLAAAFASSSQAQAVGACVTGTAQRFVENSVFRASVFNTGGLFFGGSTTSGDGYLIPKQDGTSTFYAAGLWLGGTVDGDLRVAAARYENWAFWPGPLENAASPPSDCSTHDRIFVVSREDVRRYLTTGELTDDLRDWPYQLGAPVLDGDGDPDNYDLRAGDQPDLIGDMAAWWVMQDAGNARLAAGSTAPMGVEVRAQAFAYRRDGQALSPALLQTLFVRYEIINRGDQPIEAMHASMFADPNLGAGGDDYIGTDTLRNMVFVYNDSNEDAVYGAAPPAQGIQLLMGPVVDGDTLGATATSTFINGGPPGTRDPDTAYEVYNYMRGLWGDGTPITALDNGYQTDGPVTTFMYPGDPVARAYWSHVNPGSERLPSGDRRMVLSTGAFRLPPGEAQALLVAFPFGRGSDNLNSVAVMRGYAAALQHLHAKGFFASSPVERPEPTFELGLSRVHPNPSSGTAEATLTLPTEARVRATVLDALGRQLEVLVDGELAKGETVLSLPDELAPGTYLLRVRVEPGGEETLTFTVAR
ncbi:MAG: hypothetical protein Rubg2KO_23590 [Rubricoccaceae bacterium]